MNYPRLAAGLLMLQVSIGSGYAQALDPAPVTETTPSSEEKVKKPKGKPKFRPKISGYIQYYYKARVDQDGDGVTEPDVFRFGRVKVQFSGAVSPKLTYVVEIDPRSPQIAGVMRDCYLQWEFQPNQNLRFGQMKTPFGWENRESTANLYTVTRTEVGEGFGRGLTLRDIGVGLFGRIPLGGGWRLEDEITLTNGAGLSVQADDDGRKNLFGRFGARWKGKSVTFSGGISGASGTINEPADPGPPPQPGLSTSFKNWGVDMEVDAPFLFAVAEYAKGSAEANLPDEGGDSDAWYVLVAGKTRWNLGPVVRYDTFDGTYNRWTAGGWYGAPREKFRVLVTYDWVKQDGERRDDRLLAWVQVRF